MELASFASHSLTWFENGHYLVLAWCETIDPDLGRVRREQLRLIAAMDFIMERLLHKCPTLIQIKSPNYFSEWFSFGFAVFLVCLCFFLHNICQRSHGLSAISISYLLLQLKFQMVVEVLGDFIFSCLLLSISTEIQETTEGRKLPVPGSQSLGTVFYVFAK